MSTGTLFTNITNGVATVTFGHPASNAFPGELLQRFIDTLNRLSDNESIGVIVIKSEGDKSFCAGAFFDELMSVTNEADGTRFFAGFGQLMLAMKNCSKFIVARVQGKAVGGGVGIIAASDYCFATEAADVKLSELSVGLGPFVIAPALERKIGVSGLSELALDPGNWKNAYWAKEKGLFSRVFENIREMDEAVELFAEKLAGYSPQAKKELKKILWHGTGDWATLMPDYAAINGKLVISEETKLSLQSFKNRI